MKISKIEKKDIENNYFNIFLSIFYGTILALVYSVWIIKTSGIIWLAILVALFFIVASIIFAYIWTLNVRKNSKQ